MAFMFYFVNSWLLSYLVIIVSNILSVEEKFLLSSNSFSFLMRFLRIFCNCIVDFFCLKYLIQYALKQ